MSIVRDYFLTEKAVADSSRRTDLGSVVSVCRAERAKNIQPQELEGIDTSTCDLISFVFFSCFSRIAISGL